MANETQIRSRAMSGARARVLGARVNGKLNNQFQAKSRVRRAYVVSDRFVNVDGQTYAARLATPTASSVYVVNTGRLASARYEQTSEMGILKTE